MFSYYGSKSKVVERYPRPVHRRVIEPFAGSARYALRWFDRDILLVDKSEIVIKVWKYLKGSSIGDIIGLPEPSYGEDIRDYGLGEGEELLMRFLLSRGKGRPCYTVGRYNDIRRDKRRIAGELWKVRHWEVRLGDYRGIGNEEATWFIDPPYELAGDHYAGGCNNRDIDYGELGEWCRERYGQIIVCEGRRGRFVPRWLDFCLMVRVRGMQRAFTEYIWSNMRTGYEVEQIELW